MLKKVCFIITILLLPIINCFTQTTSENISEGNVDESGWKLPPLQTLIDSAVLYSPLMKLADHEILLSQYALTDIRRDWLKKLNLSADARYGSMFDYSRLSSVSGGMFIPPSANMYILNSGAGFSMYMPISDIFDRKRLISSAKIKIEQAEIRKDDTERTVKQLVIASYYDVLTAQKTLEIRAEMRASSGMLYEQTKLDYAENRTTFSDYTKAYESYLTSQNDYETQKNNLLKAIRTLEVIVGIMLLK